MTAPAREEALARELGEWVGERVVTNRVTELVQVDRILVDRYPDRQASTRKYALDMQAGDEFPAIKLALRPDGLFEIRDGRHRLAAALSIGRREIKARSACDP